MEQTIIEIMNNWGYIGVFGLIALENIFPPIPSEVILVFGGFMITGVAASLNMPGMIIASTLGALMGGLVLYYIGKILNKERLKRIVDGKVGKVLRLKAKDIDKADKWFDEKGNKAVFFGRFIPIVRSLISIPAGMSEMPMSKFLLYTTAGSLIWNTVLIFVGTKVGANWHTIVDVIDRYSHIVLLILVVIFVGVMIWWFGYRGKKKAHNKETADSVKSVKTKKSLPAKANSEAEAISDLDENGAK